MAKEIQPEHITELNKSVEMAAQGYWMPLAVVCLLFSVIIVLLVILWTSYKKRNEESHKETRELIRELADNNKNLTTLVIRHDVEIDNIKANSHAR
jgi:hypothetical protein